MTSLRRYLTTRRALVKTNENLCFCLEKLLGEHNRLVNLVLDLRRQVERLTFERDCLRATVELYEGRRMTGEELPEA